MAISRRHALGCWLVVVTTLAYMNSGCGSAMPAPVYGWDKPNSSDNEFYQAKAECMGVAGQASGGRQTLYDPYGISAMQANQLFRDVFDTCMMGKGWRLGEAGVLGLDLYRENGRLVISKLFDNFPAQKAGIQPGDEIVEIDWKPVVQMSEDEAKYYLRGRIGSSVVVGVSRPSTNEHLTFSMQRVSSRGY